MGLKYDDLFIDSNLPESLNKKETYDLLNKMNQGDEVARETLIVHNIKLVLYEVMRRFQHIPYDKRDLVSVGNIGLIKAVNTFDVSRGMSFSTYAIRCIDNEILIFLRDKIKKEQNIESLDRFIKIGRNEEGIRFGDTLSDGTDFVGEYIDGVLYQSIRDIIEDLSSRDKEIIRLYFGFYDDKRYTMKEICEKLCVSKAYISALIEKSVTKIGKQLEKEDMIELRDKVKIKRKNS